ncbi:MAG: hypothetical protein ABIO55_14440 [Ginsengibacter sp.]
MVFTNFRRTYKISLILLFTSIVFFSCSKQNSSSSEPASFSATIDGVYWQADSVVATRVLLSLNQANFKITATGKDGKAFYLSTYSDTVSVLSFRPQAMVLIYFNAKRKVKPSNEIEISWATAEEQNTNTFAIERRLDATNWVKAGEVNAAGNSSQQIDYSWSEKPPIAIDHYYGEYFYRIKAIDKDGSFQYSHTIRLATGSPALFVFPPGDYSYGFDGQINIVTVDKEMKLMSGDFHFVCMDDKNHKQLPITNGSFKNVPYK